MCRRDRRRAWLPGHRRHPVLKLQRSVGDRAKRVRWQWGVCAKDVGCRSVSCRTRGSRPPARPFQYLSVVPGSTVAARCPCHTPPGYRVGDMRTDTRVSHQRVCGLESPAGLSAHLDCHALGLSDCRALCVACRTLLVGPCDWSLRTVIIIPTRTLSLKTCRRPGVQGSPSLSSLRRLTLTWVHRRA